jgi:peptide/nickel transport system permease protein
VYRYFGRRLLGVFPVLLVVGVFVFALLHLTPGDPAVIIAGEQATAEDVARIRDSLKLDRPLVEQFVIWAGNVLRGDLGVSIYSNQPVTALLGQRFEPTLSLAITTLIFKCLIAVPLGVLAAWRAGMMADRAIMLFAVLAFSFPVFWVGYALVLFFSVKLGWFPVQGFRSITAGVLPFLHHITLPTISLGLLQTALLARITRATTLEVLNQDYIRMARAKGLPGRQVLFVHALRNASVPIVTTIGLGTATMLGGAVVTESVFGLPGLGRLTVDAIMTRDYPVIQGLILVFAAAYVLINLLVDLLYVKLDPRINY